jgi:hypothetical protein
MLPQKDLLVSPSRRERSLYVYLHILLQVKCLPCKNRFSSNIISNFSGHLSSSLAGGGILILLVIFPAVDPTGILILNPSHPNVRVASVFVGSASFDEI